MGIHGNRYMLRLSFIAILLVAFGSLMLSLVSTRRNTFRSIVKEVQRHDDDAVIQVHIVNEHLGDRQLTNSPNEAHVSLEIRPVLPPVLQVGVLGNYEPRNLTKRVGLGEYGVAVELDPNEQDLYEKAYKAYGFNMVISDRISLDRSIPDIRDTKCKYWHYSENLPKASVVVVFHNEGWSTLMRTIHSIFKESPPHLLQQVVMVDDFSEKDHLKSKLDEYITLPRFDGKIKLVRTTEREGLIRARILGAEHSEAEVVMFLDAHCECGTNWLPPLLAEIAVNRTAVICPTVDSVEADTFVYSPQADGLCRGAFDWEFWYKRIPVEFSKENERRQYLSQPYYSPVMAGGLFAIDRSYFFQIGGYDPGLEIWGAENFEISFKIWMCGGTLLFSPCSRVGHIYRRGVPYKYKDLGTGVSVVHHNYLRVAEVWLDEYKEYFYAARPDLRGKPHGNISSQVKYRKDNCPHSFKWYMDEIAYDVIQMFPPPSPNVAWGEVRAVDSNLCLDSMGRHDQGGPMGISACHSMGGNQLFRINEGGALLFNDHCLYVNKQGSIRTQRCRGPRGESIRIWKYDKLNQRMFVPESNMCLDHDIEKALVFVSPCDGSRKSQLFRMAPPNK